MNVGVSVNLKLLNAFVAVADSESFRLAAERLNRSHSAVSAQINQLEAQLGVRLFERTTRKVKLTAEGMQLRESAQRAVYEIELGMRRIQETADIKNGKVSVACSSSIAASYMPKILARFMAEFPLIAVTVRELTSQDLHEALRARDVDFAIGPLFDAAEMDFLTILTEELYAVTPRGLVDPTQGDIRLSELARLPILLSTASTAMRRLLDDTMRRHGLQFSTQFQFIQAQTLVAMAEAGLGVAILPESSLHSAPCRNARIVRIVEPDLKREIALIKNRNRQLPPAANRLFEMIRNDIAAVKQATVKESRQHAAASTRKRSLPRRD